MKTFLAIYLGTPESMARWQALPEPVRAQRGQDGVRAWHAWVERHKERLTDVGAPLGKTKAASAAGIADVRNAMTGYTVVRAETHDEAARMFEHHPHFTIFPGESIEIMECLPIPENMASR